LQTQLLHTNVPLRSPPPSGYLLHGTKHRNVQTIARKLNSRRPWSTYMFTHKMSSQHRWHKMSSHHRWK